MNQGVWASIVQLSHFLFHTLTSISLLSVVFIYERSSPDHFDRCHLKDFVEVKFSLLC